MKTVFMKKKMLLAGAMAAALVGCGQVAEEAQAPEQQAVSDVTSDETPNIENTETEDSVSETESDELLTSVYASAKVGNTLTFGTYEQDNDLSNGQEPIQWEVVDVTSDSIKLISSYILDVRENGCIDKDEPYTWANSRIRSWLNEDFLNTAFTEEEQDCIKVTTMESPGWKYKADNGGEYRDNSIYDGGNTQDKIFVPAYEENFPWSCEPTDAATAAESAYRSEYKSCMAGEYWLRNPVIFIHSDGSEEDYTVNSYTFSDGSLCYGGIGYLGVRPVMWLRIK